jgi:cytochrome c oxidase subunit 2
MIQTSLRNAVIAFTALAGTLVGSNAAAWAEGKAVPWQMGFQEAATPVMERITGFHNLLLVIITVIVIFVTALLLFVIVRFRASRNPVPSKTTHNTLLEVIWTAVPIMILVVIAVPSFRLLYFADQVPEKAARAAGAPVMTIKATGYQWYWVYEYAKVDKAGTNLRFESRLACRGTKDKDTGRTDCQDFEKEKGYKPLRLLDVDNRIVVPVGAYVRLQVTAADVIHSWAMPAFGIKLDGAPGRLNETWFRATKKGVFYGMCSELCGVDHGYMPIAVEVVSMEKYQAWVARALKSDDYEKIKAAAPAKTPTAIARAAKAVKTND